jgi:prepilin-type processing-associated H-X9-DG protein
MTFPQMEQQQIYDQFANGNPGDASGKLPYLAMLVCPSNPPATQSEPWLSYVGNAGYTDRPEQPIASATLENAANGVFFDRTRLAEMTPTPSPAWAGQDARDSQNQPEITMSMAYIQAKGDGTTQTLMLSESLGALYWSYPPSDYGAAIDEPYHFGFNWVQPAQVLQDKKLRVNGAKDPVTYSSMQEMKDFLTDTSGSDLKQRAGIASSNHSGGVNATFVDGHVQLINDQVDPFVFAQLMTSNHKQSKLGTSPNFEATTAQPADGSY